MNSNKPLAFFTILVIMLTVFLLNMTFAYKISGHTLLFTRFAFVVVFYSAWRIFSAKGKSHTGDITFALMAVNLAFFTVSFFTPGLWNLNLASAKGLAFAKLSDSVVICLVLLVSFLTAGYKPGSMFLAKGRLTPGLVIGITAFILMAFVAIKTNAQPIGNDFVRRNLIWILIFVFSNACMEELLFRGIFLHPANNFMKPVWAVVLTSIVFAAAHLQVTYTPDVVLFSGITFVLAIAWGFLMLYTKSILASMLFHAGSDLVIILPIYYSFGAI